MYNIDAINNLVCTVTYCTEAVAEYKAGLGDGIIKYTERFEEDYIMGTVATDDSDDIGGLIVYLNKGEAVAVYDYENFCGWVL